MKTKYLLLCFISSIALTGCNKNFKIKTNFSYEDKSVVIKDTLKRVKNKTAHVVFLYGQSNAVGFTGSNYLKTNNIEKYNEYLSGYDNVFINYFNDGGYNTSDYSFKKATLGCGCTTESFGPEMGIAEKMAQAYPNDQTFIVKWAWGGTELHKIWLDGNLGRGQLYNPAMDLSIKCLSYLGSKGYSLSIEGICWMQGESDSFYEDWNQYYNDTNAFVSFLRDDLKGASESIKFVDAGINEGIIFWTYASQVNHAKKEFAAKSDLNIYIDTNALGLTSLNEPEENPDIAHYDSLSMVKLGKAFGDALTGK